MMTEGFVRGKATPCAFRHQSKGLRVVVHGDDFTVPESEKELDWFRERMSGRFEVKFCGRLGPGDEDPRA